jgi:hypothetical protein
LRRQLLPSTVTRSPPKPRRQANRVYDYSPLAVDSDTVVYEGRIVGRDPDPNVRLSIIRDPHVDG